MANSFSICMMKEGKQLNVSHLNGTYYFNYDGKRIVFPKYRPEHTVSIAIGANHLIVSGWEEDKPFVPYNLKVYNFEGDYLWDIGDIARSVSPRRDAFYYVECYTKETLAQQNWWLFRGCLLDEGHEYVTAYDGTEQWLFDITDRKLVKRIFTK